MSAYDPIAMLAELETAGVPRKQAEAITGVVTNGRTDLVTKTDLNSQLSLLKADLRVDLANLNAALDSKLNAFAWRICGTFGVMMGLGFAALGVLIDLHK